MMNKHSALYACMIAQIFDALDSRISHKASMLDKLYKQKSGLMHDLLTGKVEVKAD